MPRLLAFVACEKVITDQRSNNVSLVGLLHNLQIALDPAKVPEDAAVSLRWEIFSMWLSEEGDHGRRYIVDYALLSPDSKPLFSNSQEFVVESATHRLTMLINAFPISGTGRYSVLLSLREAVTGSEVRDFPAYPIDVSFGGPATVGV